MSTVQLYRHYDAKNKLLYVGIARNAGFRFSEHKIHSKWAHASVRMTVEMYPDRLSAMRAELAAIASEKPLHNLSHLERTRLTNKCPVPSGRPRRDEPTVMLSARVSKSVVEKINKKCTRTGETRSQMIEKALVKFLKNTS